MNLWHKLLNWWGWMRIYMSTFDYDRMTPELAAYLGHRDRPRYLYPKDEAGNTLSSKPTPESEAAVDAWRAEHEALKAKCGEGEPRGYYQAHKEWLCRDETQEGEPKEHTSPSGKYRLVVTRHGTGPGTWNYSKGRVYAGDKLLTTVCRNYGAFPFTWVEGHPKGSFLVCGEDYQGQTVIDLVTGDRKDFLPKEANQGAGFCWAAIHPSPDGMLLAVEGCYWACPYEVRIVDFSDPMNPPWLKCESPEWGDEEPEHFRGWTGPSTCKVGIELTVVDLPGHWLHEKRQYKMSPEEHLEHAKEVAERGVKDDDDSDCDPGFKRMFFDQPWTVR